MGWVVNAKPRPFYPRVRDLIPIVHETKWNRDLVWIVKENLASTGIRSPDHLPCSESLYRLNCNTAVKR